MTAQELIGFHTQGETVIPITGAGRTYRTATSNDDIERQHREVRTVPSTLRTDFTIQGRTPHFDQIDQADIRALLAKGRFITTELSARSSRASQTALLMSYAPGHVYSGRGGILLHQRGGELAPVTLTVATSHGKRRFLLDIKGTGTPDGILIRHAERGLIGGLSSGGKGEFDSLQAAERQHPFSKEGLVPVAVYYGVDSRGFGQVARAIPTTLRPSFRENEAFEQLRQLSPEQLSRGLGRELGRYLAFTPPLLASNLQTENAYLVDTRNGQEVIATDFMEIVPLHKLVEPQRDLSIALKIMKLSMYEDPVALQNITRGVAEGMQEVRPGIALDLAGIGLLSTPDTVADCLLEKYLAKEVIQNRLSSGTVIDAAYIISRFDSILSKFYRTNPGLVMPRAIVDYLEEESRLFSCLNPRDSKVLQAQEYIKAAQRRLQYAAKNFQITNANIHEYENLLPIPFYQQ